MYWNEATESLLRPLTRAARLGVVTDMDGTISPIVPRPEDAQPTPRSRELLAALAGRITLVAAISGRAADDLRQRIGLDDHMVFVGNHGLERWADGQVMPDPATDAYRAALEQLKNALNARIREALPLEHTLAGVEIEDKARTLSIHYRRATDPTTAADWLRPHLQDLTRQHDLKLFEGRMLFEVRPPLDINKGTAFAQLVREFQLDAAVYLGDDTTDADAMRVARELRQAGQCYALGLGVEGDETPAAVREQAAVLARGIQDVEAFFAWLLRALKA